MNLILDYSQFDVHKVHFLDTKKNIIIDGIFTKMVYLDHIVSLNAIYILFPCNYCIDRGATRNNIMFSLNTQENKDIMDLETAILNTYMKHYQVNKKMNANLSTQIMNGRTRLYREGTSIGDSTVESPDIVLKISGVWETENEVGITHKFVEMYKP
jgi:hypothetical protein